MNTTNRCQVSITSLSSNQWTPTATSYSYYIKDHLGSVRIVANSSGAAEQKNTYYAFGGLMADLCTGDDVQPYKFQGKELDRTHGLEWNDHGARFADLLTARWMTMDPLCEKFYAMTPYLLCGGNMVRFVDKDGKEVLNGFPNKPLENKAKDNYISKINDLYNAIIVFAHGISDNNKPISGISFNGENIYTPGEMEHMLSENSAIYNQWSIGKGFESQVQIVLFSCNEGQTGLLAEQLSIFMEDVPVYGPGDIAEINVETGRIDVRNNKGWNKYINGKLVSNTPGNILPGTQEFQTSEELTEELFPTPDIFKSTYK